MRVRPSHPTLIRTLIVLGAVVGVGALLFSRIEPSNQRAWKSDHARHPVVTFDGDHVTIHGVRDFRDQPPIERYDARTYDLARIESLWFVVSVFDEKERRGPAHTMLSFGFGGGEYVVISVEARKETGEFYSIYRGMVKQYELIYVIGDERDLILTRAVHRSDDVYLYPVRTTQEKIRALFVDMLEAAHGLGERPEYYNTLTNNCTSRLRDHVNAISPGRIPPTWRTILPGYSGEFLSGLGLLDEGLNAEDARRRYWINERARRHADADDFSDRIRALDDGPPKDRPTDSGPLSR